jgi:hypothetical protein
MAEEVINIIESYLASNLNNAEISSKIAEMQKRSFVRSCNNADPIYSLIIIGLHIKSAHLDHNMILRFMGLDIDCKYTLLFNDLIVNYVRKNVENSSFTSGVIYPCAARLSLEDIKKNYKLLKEIYFEQYNVNINPLILREQMIDKINMRNEKIRELADELSELERTNVINSLNNTDYKNILEILLF